VRRVQRDQAADPHILRLQVAGLAQNPPGFRLFTVGNQVDPVRAKLPRYLMIRFLTVCPPAIVVPRM